MNDRRRATRFTLPAGYTSVQVRLLDAPEEDLHGHASNVSATGVRFELDHPLPAGSRIAMRIELPGPRGAGLRPGQAAHPRLDSTPALHGGRPGSIIEAAPNPAIYAIATLIWLDEDPDEPGPVRMGARFEAFPRAGDQRRLSTLIADGRYAEAA